MGLPIPYTWTYNLWVLEGINFLSLGFAIAAICIRLKDPDRRFLLKRTERAEGVYIVPHSPMLAAFFIGAFASLMMIALAIIYMFWTKHKYAQGIQTLSPMIPIPLWAWVWTSLFAPVYACHLFPPDVVEQATSPRIMRLIRRKPKVVNTLCYGGPVIIGLPITGLSAIWASRNALARTTMSAHDTYVAGVVYQSLYALWALIFLGTAALFIIYSVALIRILRMQLSTLKKLDRASRIAKSKEEHMAALNDEDLQQPTNYAMHELTTTGAPLSSAGLSFSGEIDKDRPSQSRRQSWFKKANVFQRSTSSNGESSLQKELGRYSKLELLRLNSRIIVYEAVIFSLFCFAWSGFGMARSCAGPGVVKDTRYISRIFLVQAWIGSVFGLCAAFLIYWRGRNVAQTRMGSSPSLRQQNAFQVLAAKLASPKIAALRDDAISDDHIHVEIELLRTETKAYSPDNISDDEKHADYVSFPAPAAASSQPWSAPQEWEQARLASGGMVTRTGSGSSDGSISRPPPMRQGRMGSIVSFAKNVRM